VKTITCALLIGMTVGSFGCSGGARAVPPSVGERAEVVPAAPALAPAAPTAAPDVAAVKPTPAKVARAARSTDHASTKPVGGVVVKRLVVATGVKNRQPEGVATLFRQAEVDRLYAFVEVDNRSGAANEVRVSFEPPDGGAERGDVELAVGESHGWRTWAYTRDARRVGSWTAIVRDADGKILARTPFEIAL
jgi:hypothetical protein